MLMLKYLRRLEIEDAYYIAIREGWLVGRYHEKLLEDLMSFAQVNASVASVKAHIESEGPYHKGHS